MSGVQDTNGHFAVGIAELADGNAAAARQALAMHWNAVEEFPEAAAVVRAWVAQAALAEGDLAAAGRWADEAVATAVGWHSTVALLTRARVAIAAEAPQRAEHDLYAALAGMTAGGAYLGLADVIECLAALAALRGAHHEAARLFGAAHSVRDRTGEVRFKIYDSGWRNSIEALRATIGDSDFETAWSGGAALSTDEAIAYVQRGRGQRKRPPTGWESLTPTELDVARLVAEGLGNKEIGAKLFISHRTVQTHLTHVYAKLGVTSRVQLAQHAARRQGRG